jgi:hypothetical protein
MNIALLTPDLNRTTRSQSISKLTPPPIEKVPTETKKEKG